VLTGERKLLLSIEVECPLCAKSGHWGASLLTLPITEDTFSIYPIMYAFSLKLLLRGIILHNCKILFKNKGMSFPSKRVEQ